MKELEVESTITEKEKQMLKIALDGINGLSFKPITVVKKGEEDYYFICEVKTLIRNLQMKMAKVYVRVQEEDNPKLLSIEKLS
ncbi:hypothetical protein CDLVIII_4514 [Clostridium sp. DL-VIII]|uniref:hypothetical protein n=1 Tax=Clostridium sp. DL-VIII TaxID=641107 RepID=UPI00023B0744|nr:hypothetical protein [Clostridium sp. DL-VIII]EHJ01022.1 hypothetical protein CDLVIII_4514 [Clostridium sp. DL-VIII]